MYAQPDNARPPKRTDSPGSPGVPQAEPGKASAAGENAGCLFCRYRSPKPGKEGSHA